MTDEIQKRLHDTVRLHLPGATDDALLPPEASLLELGVSSLATVNLVLDLEVAFGIEFPDEMLTAATFQTLATLETVLRQLVTRPVSADA